MSRTIVPALLLACAIGFAAPARAEIKTQWVNLYSGTKYGFSTPKNPAEQRANEESKFAAKRFFKDVFGL